MIIENENTSLDIGRACSCLGIDKNRYLRRLEKQENPCKVQRNLEVRNEIQEIAVNFPRYGYRRITKELQRRGFPVNHKRVLRMMREDNLLCLKKVFHPRTTDSDHGFRVFPNLAKGLELLRLNQLWVSDITYIRLSREFVYLAIILDVFSRKCIGWRLDRNIDTQLTIEALNMALLKRGNNNLSGLIHHSDQGVQYASIEYVKKLEENKIRISMSRKGNPYDNAFAESFIKTLKFEEVYMKEYEDFNDAWENIREFIEEVYNEKRLHSSIGYLPPNEFEKELVLN